MSKKFFFLTALAACFVLAVAPVMAAERTNDRSADRVQRGADRTSTSADDNDVSDTFSEEVILSTDRARVPSQSQLNLYAAQGMLGQAKQLQAAGDADAAMALLTRIARMDLADSPMAEEIRVKIYDSMASLYAAAPHKQVAYLNQALRHAADGSKQAYRDQITALGGVIVEEAAVLTATTSTATTRVAGPGDDSCETAAPAVLPIETQDISDPFDANWRFFDITDPIGQITSIETLINAGTDIPDTSVWLYEAPCPGTEIGFDEDGGESYMSLLDAGCLAPGTYYVEVRGWCPSAAFGEHCAPGDPATVVGSYDLEISLSDCPTELPPDNYEPDDSREMANNIGHPSSTPLNANAWGRAKKDIQTKTIGIAGDIDWNIFKLTRVELVRFGTMGQYPTFFNGFEAIPLEIPGRSDPEDGVDRNMYYEVEPDGCCSTSANCPAPGPPCTYQERLGAVNPIVVDNNQNLDTPNDSPVCLPNTRNANTSASVIEGIDWMTSVAGASEADIFEYQVRVSNEVQCTFEVEPNQAIEDAMPLVLGETRYGFFDYNVTVPNQDADLYDFNVDELSLVSIYTNGPNPLQTDTFIDIFVGPLGPPFDPIFIPTGLTSEDSGGTFLSRIDIPGLPPAADLLAGAGLPAGDDPRYLLRVTSNYLNPNFSYSVESTVAAFPTPEVEPNDFSEAGSNWMAINTDQVISANVLEGCDMDTFKIAFVESTYVRVETAAGTLSDTILEMVSCQDGAVIANTCNDDGGAGLASRLEGCLGVGDHCFRVRSFSASATGSYEVTVQEVGTECPAMDPPSMNSSGSNIGCSTNSCL
jgi:hypothetical protein